MPSILDLKINLFIISSLYRMINNTVDSKDQFPLFASFKASFYHHADFYSKTRFVYNKGNQYYYQIIIKMSSTTLIILLFFLKTFLFQQQFTIDAQFKSCDNLPSNSSTISENSIASQAQHQKPQINQHYSFQTNPKIHDQFIGFFHLRSTYIFQQSTLQFCPIDFIPGQAIQILLSAESPVGQQVKINKITFYPQQNKCHTIDLQSIDFQTNIYGKTIIFKVKSSCQNIASQNTIYNLQIRYKETSRSLFRILKQLFKNLMASLIIICIVYLVCYALKPYLFDFSQETASNKNKQMQYETVRQFDTIMPSFLLLNQQNGDFQCSICLLLIKEEEEVRLTPCKHAFHKVCIDRWGVKKPICPSCRGSLSLPSPLRKQSNQEN